MRTAEEPAAFAAIERHAMTCARCRGGDHACPEAAALYRAWRPTISFALPEEAPRAHRHV